MQALQKVDADPLLFFRCLTISSASTARQDSTKPIASTDINLSIFAGAVICVSSRLNPLLFRLPNSASICQRSPYASIPLPSLSLQTRARGGGSSDPCTPGGVELAMSPGLALREAGSQESSAGGFRRAELARREPGWISSRWARITQAGPGPRRPGRRDVHFALERALLTAHLDGEMHLSRAECTSRRAQDRPAPTTPNGFRPRRPAPTPAH